MTQTSPAAPPELHQIVTQWYAEHARVLPWRSDSTSAWGVLVSEIMLQQTPVVRVEPVWREWMNQWPTPQDLAKASQGEVLRAWGRLGYPRRALRLYECASVLRDQYGGEVPLDEETLLTLPGVGEYTAAAVAAFAGGRRTVVIDTNIRRVHARVLNAAPHAAPSLSAAERALAARLLPQDTQTSIQWNVGIMELGALICKARAPQCQICPLQQHCAWYATGESLPEDSTRPRQLWHGTDRQMRGKIMAHLPDTPTSVTEEDLRNALRITTEDQNQFTRCLASLTKDGLAVHNEGKIALPGT